MAVGSLYLLLNGRGRRGWHQAALTDLEEKPVFAKIKAHRKEDAYRRGDLLPGGLLKQRGGEETRDRKV